MRPGNRVIWSALSALPFVSCVALAETRTVATAGYLSVTTTQSSSGRSSSSSSRTSGIFSDFGKDIPGYKDPSVIHPFSEFGRDLQSHVSPTAQPIYIAPMEIPEPEAPKGNLAAPDESANLKSAAERGAAADWTDADPASLETARGNFKALVENFLARVGTAGCWSVREGRTKLCLTYFASDDEHVKSVGPGVYSGMVVLRDSVHRINKPATFTIDMTDSTWSVRSVRFLAAKTELYDRSSAEAPPPAR